ncbi:MAG: hypothetical protein H0W28_11500 [Pyrinomonadaceae bacterium]|nr:hypothetical protein [Pyrinomonadaceae bacterium]
MNRRIQLHARFRVLFVGQEHAANFCAVYERDPARQCGHADLCCGLIPDGLDIHLEGFGLSISFKGVGERMVYGHQVLTGPAVFEPAAFKRV